MPYRIERRSSCPPDRPFAVVLESSGEVVACHVTRAGAERQVAAIYAAEGDIEKQQPSLSQVHVDTIMGGSRRRRKPRYEPSVLIKGDYVGHPFRGNQWTDASGISRGQAGSDVARGVPLLTPATSVAEARQTGRPLAAIHPEHYPRAVKTALAANRQAAAAMDALFQKHAIAPSPRLSDDQRKTLENDPDYAIISLALTVSAFQARMALQTAYAQELGFEVIEPDANGKYPPEAEFAYEYVDRNPEGRLRRTEEVARESDIGGESALVRYSGAVARGPLVLANPDGSVSVLWGETTSVMARQDERADAHTNIDRVDMREVFGRRDSSTWRDTEGGDVLRGARGGDVARAALVAEAARLGIQLPPITLGPILSARALVAAGVDREEIGSLIRHVDDVGHTFLTIHEAILSEDSWQWRGQERERVRLLAEQAQHITPDTKISVTAPQSAVMSILKDGRIKTQFETGKSGGKNVPAIREKWEAVMFGYPRGMPPEARPIYGMVETDGVKPSSARGNEQYGTVTLVLKDTVRERTTTTRGDSLFTNSAYVPINEASTRLAERPSTREATKPQYVYYEAQIHGGVQVADIERVIIDRSTYKDYEWTTVEPSASLLKALNKAGIPYEIRDGRAEKQAAEAVGKRRIDLSVLIKGDYVGHPFRGNQWTDASGSSASRNALGSILELATAKKRFGSTSQELSAYFREKHGLKIDVQKFDKDAHSMQATLGMVQALDDMLSRGFQLPANIRDMTILAYPTESDGAVAPIGDGTAEMHLSAPSIAQTAGRIFNGEVPKGFSITADFASQNNPPLGVLTQRLGYAIMVHEYAHALDINPSRAEALKGRVYLSDSLDHDGSLSVNDMNRITEELKATAISTYGSFNRQEFVAEAFTAWILGDPRGKALVRPFLNLIPNPPVLKGDYVGHPFRGNQWVDSSGAGRSVASSTRAAGHPSERLLLGVREYRVHPVEALPSRWAPTLFVDGKPTTLQGRVSHHTKAKAERELVKFQEQTEALLAKTTAVKEVEGTDRPLTEIDTEVNGRRTLQRIGWGEEGRVEALEQYSRNSIELNRRLRSGELADGPLDEYMSGGSTMAVFRSISNDRGTADRIASELEGGATVIDRGYASTSRKLVEAQQMDAVGDGIILRIVMPSGSPRIEVPDGVGFDQDEVILPRNTALRPTGKVTTDDEGRRVFDVEVVDDADVQKALLSVLKGDYEGHPFRGNQWMDASGVSRGDAGSSPDQDRQAYEMRAAGQSWEQIARTLGYANGGSVRRLAMRHEARLKAEGGGVEVKPQPEPNKPPVGPQTGYVNGLRVASSDPYVAAAEGRPLQGWVTFSPAIQARLDARDVALVEQAALEREARDLAEAHLETLTPEERKQQRSYARTEAIAWALENNPEFARKYDAWQARGGFPDVNQLASDMKDELMVAAGITRRTPEQIASMLADAKILDDYNQPREVRDAARQRLEAQGTSLEYFDEHREGGKGGRLEVTPHSLRLRYHSWDREADAKFGRQFLVEFDITGLRARGYSDQQIGDIIRTAERVAADRTYTPTYFAVRNNLKTLAEAEARQNEAIGALEEQVKDAPVSITVPPRILAQVLNEGRYKTQFETRKSGGYNSPQSRQEEEADRFGYPPHMAVEQRPVYGMVETGGVTAPSVRENLQYGSAVIVLKPEVRERTTFTVGDSLSNNKPSAPLTNPRAVPAVLGFDDYIPTADQIRSQGAYLEAQIHGGVRSSDIAYVVFEVGADIIGTGVRDEGQKIGLSKPPTPALLKSLERSGIPYVIVPAGGEVKPPIGKSRGLYFGPTILLKGDYVGHPFRGNQWTDAAGATQDASNLGRQDRIEAATIAEKINEKTSNLLVADATITAYPEGLPAALRNKYDKELMNIDVNDPDMINGISLAAAAVEGDNHVVTLNLKDGELAGALQMSQSPSDRFDGFKAFKMFDLGSTFIVDGAGSALFGYAVRRAAANGAGLTLEPLDKKAVAFWKSMGFTSRFTPIGYSQNYFQTMEMSPAMVAEIASGLDPDETSES